MAGTQQTASGCDAGARYGIPHPRATDNRSEIENSSIGAQCPSLVDLFMDRSLAIKCTIHPFLSAYKACSDEARAMFGRTQFKHLASLQFPYMKDRDLVMQLLQVYDDASRTFHVGGRTLTLTEAHVRQMLGLKTVGKGFTLEGGQPKNMKKAGVWKRHFGSKKPKYRQLADVLKTINTGAEGGNMEQFKLLLLILFGSFLFPYGESAIYPSLFEVVDCAEEIDDYAWATIVHDMLHDGLHDLKVGATKDLKGCGLLLIVWAHEMFDVPAAVKEGATVVALKHDYQMTFKALLEAKNCSFPDVDEAFFRVGAFECQVGEPHADGDQSAESQAAESPMPSPMDLGLNLDAIGDEMSAEDQMQVEVRELKESNAQLDERLQAALKACSELETKVKELTDSERKLADEVRTHYDTT